ncbi:DNA-directed RNA polymerase I subunit rpa49 [Coemansia sp. Benny D115]|nr:DNA-directed RNA polymerase I subunit rpa49 [Coemansia sp. Benny D115]
MGSKRKSMESGDKPSKNSKNRANEAAESRSGSSGRGSGNVKVSIDSSKAIVQPVLAKFTSTVPPVASLFTAYKCLDSERKDACLVVSETEKIEFVGQSHEDKKALFPGSSYLVGVYNKATDTVTFRQAPLVQVSTVIKSLKNAEGVRERSNADYRTAKDELGVAFGNKKAKAQIRAVERNKINMDNVNNDMDVIGATIEHRVSLIPNRDDLVNANNRNLPIPKYDAKAKSPCDIFDMESILPKSLHSFIPVQGLARATDPSEYKDFTNTRSQFVLRKIEKILDTATPDLDALRHALYLGMLISFTRIAGHNLQKREDCLRTMKCSPEVADFIFDSFVDCVAGAVNPDGSPVFTKTTALSNKLICYISVLMLSLNNWVVYPTEMGADLSMSNKKAESYLRNVGCKMEPASAEEVKMNTFSKRVKVTSLKKAVLKAPIEFPTLSMRLKD